MHSLTLHSRNMPKKLNPILQMKKQTGGEVAGTWPKSGVVNSEGGCESEEDDSGSPQHH